ncbi:COG4315 family predicted lipoprotein [Saccharopolyspora sp. NPDC002376]
MPDLGAAVLTGPDGRTVYLFDQDGKSEPTCLEQCASDWPPLTTTDPPVAGAEVNQELLSTALRPDGKQQVVYNGHPLYYYVGDDVPGQTNGQGVFSDGGYWYALSPAGDRI